MNKAIGVKLTLLVLAVTILFNGTAQAAALAWSYSFESGASVQQLVADGSGGVAAIFGGTDPISNAPISGVVWLDSKGHEVYKNHFDPNTSFPSAIVGVTDRSFVYEINRNTFIEVNNQGHESVIENIGRVDSSILSVFADKDGFFGLVNGDSLQIVRYTYKKGR
jgi:hypothetical protein